MWTKLLSRQDVDIPTVSVVNIVMYDAIWQYTKIKQEVLFTHFYQNNFTHYINADQHSVGIYQLKKYFNTPNKIKKYYKRGVQLIKRTEKRTRYWQSRLRTDKSKHSWLSAFRELKKSFLSMNFDYSVRPWWVIESWQKDCEEIVCRLINKNNLFEFENQVFNALYRPWRPTAVNKIQAELKSGATAKQLADKYQFLRSWALVWYKERDNDWLKNISLAGKDKQKTFSWGKIVKLLQPDKKERLLIELSPYMTFFKDWRDELRRKFSFEWSFIFDEISKRYQLERHDLGYLLLDEIEDLLKTERVDKAQLRRRKKIHALLRWTLKPKE